jgi:hypothetical protein
MIWKHKKNQFEAKKKNKKFKIFPKEFLKRKNKQVR